MHGSDVKALRITATGDTTLGPCRIVGMHVSHTGVGSGRVTFREETVSGEVRLDLDFDAGADTNDVDIPGNGVKFKRGVWASNFTNLTAATIFYTG